MIEQHLQELLYTKSSFNIPGLCYVTSSDQTSVYNESSGIYSPPSKSFELTAAKTEDDGFLIAEVAKEKSNSAEAKLAVEKFVVAALKGLEDQGEFEINGIGTLTKSADGLSLEIVEGVNFREEVYGMKSFYVKPLSEKEEVKSVAVVATGKDNEEPKKETVIKETNTEVVAEKVDKTKEEEEPVQNKSLVGIILVPILFIGLLGGGIYGFLTYGPEVLEMVGVGTEVASEEEEDDSDSESSEDDHVAEEHDEEFASTEHEEIEEIEATSFDEGEIKAISELSERYHIVAGAFGVESNARRFASRHSGSVIVRSGDLNLVMLGNYHSEAEAREDLIEFKNSVGPAVWLKIR